jgi:hypothetical protein
LSFVLAAVGMAMAFGLLLEEIMRTNVDTMDELHGVTVDTIIRIVEGLQEKCKRLLTSADIRETLYLSYFMQSYQGAR